MFSNSDSGYWALTPELQEKFKNVVALNQKLQAKLGIEPMTIEERAESLKKHKEEEARLRSILGGRRPAPKWKL